MRGKSFSDKLTWVLLELLIEYVYKEWGLKVYCDVNQRHLLSVAGCTKSEISLLSNSKCSFDEYSKLVNQSLVGSHYRKIQAVSCGNIESESITISELSSFLKNLNVAQDMVNNINIVVSEIMSNALEHASADCLVDVDFCENDVTISINIVVLNFSMYLLGDGLKSKLYNKVNINDRHLQLIKALIYHKEQEFFDEKYTEDLFYTLATFQDKITSRDLTKDRIDNTGGTG